MHIDKETYKIETKNRYKSVTKKTQIVIGFSLRKDDYHINRLKHREYGNSKGWNTYTISRDGAVYEHYNPKYYSDYLDLKNADKRIISIVLENMGSLIRIPNGDYINWINEKCDKENVIQKKWMGQNYWENFTPEQIESTVTLCKKLSIDFKIPKKVIDFHHQHMDIVSFKGITLKSNYFEDCSSINPLFNLIQFNELLMLTE